MDLSTNAQLYRATHYRAHQPWQQAVYVKPLKDQRQRPVGVVAGANVIPEDFWRRRIPVMVNEILRREITDSQLFAEVKSEPGPQDLVLESSLTDMHGAFVRPDFGWLSYGVATLKVKLMGPVDASGQRPILLEEEYQGHIKTPKRMSKSPPQVPPLMGMALHKSILHMLQSLEAQQLQQEQQGEKEQ